MEQLINSLFTGAETHIFSGWLFLLWLLYLSLFNVARPWLGFQWDVLLLETGFLAIFFAPWTTRPEWPPAAAAPKIILWLFYWLLFRLMFSSGVAKLRSGDPTWRKLTALAHHYETQPLPTPIAWHMHQTSLAFHRFSARVMFAIEVIVPMLIVGPPPIRYAA